ncbi:MAG: hypothetical protein COV47_05765 [Candidatus Diapherotrites archaeon CG11_big_fil_rev_8_21_14_0_20_37_9]|nr:MAG: hypothetical protein COV47_05765 [Candidatus Diapherotrites archaeon CG11_big_fil_rev_8_21_14_0_20_37_9]
MDYAIKVLSKLVSFNTDSSQKSNYLECAAYIASEGKKLGLKVTKINFKGKDGKPRPNVLLEWNVNAQETAMLLTHFDVVPAGKGWSTNPFVLTKKGNYYYGRGTNDDKGAIASCFAAIHEMKKSNAIPSKNVKILVVCDEEVGGEEGVGLVIKNKSSLIEADFCVAIDGTLEDFSIGCSGIIRGDIIFSGKGGHAAYDFKTGNLLEKTILFANGLSDYKNIRKKKKSIIGAPENPVSDKMFGRFNITKFNAGTQYNVLPAEATIGFDLRLLPEENGKKVALDFTSFVKKKSTQFGLIPKFNYTITEGYYTLEKKFTPIIKKAAEKAVGKKLKSVSEFGGTDSRFISLLGTPAYTFGPGGSGLHSNKERISFADIKKTAKFIKFILS